MATGFQMIVQSSNSSQVQKLHVNQSMDFQTPVTVEVEGSGMYLITIILITEESGIVGSGVEYTEVIVGSPGMANPGITTGTCTECVCMCVCILPALYTGAVVAVVVAVVVACILTLILSSVLGVFILVYMFRNHKNKISHVTVNE